MTETEHALQSRVLALEKVVSHVMLEAYLSLALVVVACVVLVVLKLIGQENAQGHCTWIRVPRVQTNNILDGGIPIEMCAQTNVLRYAKPDNAK